MKNENYECFKMFKDILKKFLINQPYLEEQLIRILGIRQVPVAFRLKLVIPES